MTSVQPNVHEIFEAGQNVAGTSILQKVNARYIVTFFEDILLSLFDQWLQQWAYPGDEGYGSIFKELKLFECILIYEKCQFNPQILWQCIHQGHEVFCISFVF